jgi:hypothetical protein
VRNTRIILQNIGFAPSVGHQADHEFGGKSRAAYDGFAGEHVRRKRDARMIHDGWLSDPVFRIDITRTWRGTRSRTGPTAPPGECTRVPGWGPRASIYSIPTTAMPRWRSSSWRPPSGTASNAAMPSRSTRAISGSKGRTRSLRAAAIWGPGAAARPCTRTASSSSAARPGRGRSGFARRDSAGGIHHAEQWRLDHVRQIPELTARDTGDHRTRRSLSDPDPKWLASQG